MTEKQKKALLKSEGWSQRRDSEFGDLIWIDPKGQSERWNTPTAFAIASRRKRQREARALRKAGYVSSWQYRGKWYLDAIFHANKPWGERRDYLTRQEALQTLEKQP